MNVTTRAAMGATCASLLVSLAGASASQRIIDTIDADGRGLDLTYVRDFPDIDGDGFRDLLVSDVTAPGYGGSYIVCLSGQTLLPIWTTQVGLTNLSGQSCGDGETVNLGDFNGDGQDDVADGCPAFGYLPSEVFILNGTTGQVLQDIVRYETDFGNYIGAPGDTNGDGFADMLVSDAQGTQTLYLGPDARIGYTLDGPAVRPIGLGGVGDLDFDGCDDFAIGWGGAGFLRIYSGRTGSTLTDVCVTPNICIGQFGRYIIRMGDLNGDTVPDFAVSGAGLGYVAGPFGVGIVQMISGADFSVIHEIQGRTLAPSVGGNGEYFGSVLGGGHDVNGDGIADLVAVAGGPSRDSDSATLISGRTGQILYQVRPVSDGGILDFGIGVFAGTTLSDIDGDGYGDWAVGNNKWHGGGFNSGRIYLLAGGPGDVEPVCEALPHSLGDAANIQLYGAITEFARGLEIMIDSAIPGSVATVFFGTRGAPLALGDGVLCIEPQSRVRYGGPLALDSTGFAQRTVDWGHPVIGQGPTAWTAGRSWTVQAAFRDPGAASGINTTNAIEVTLNR